METETTTTTTYPKPIDPQQTRVGWVGIGVMGSAMASRILSAGFSLTVFARTPHKALSLQQQGAHIANSLTDLARSTDVVFTMVGHPSDVRFVLLGDKGVLANLNKGGVLVDHTSSHPDLAREIASEAESRGCWAVDAPVSGGDIGARDGKLAIFAGGDSDVIAWLTPLLQLMGKPTYMGKSGCGQSCKIANQITVGANLLGLSEGLVFAKQRGGLDLKKWLECVRGGAAGSMVMELFGERMIERDFRAGGFVEYMVKDLGMGLDGSEDKAVVLPGAALCKQLFAGMVGNGDGKMGTQGLVTVLERINGISESFKDCTSLDATKAFWERVSGISRFFKFSKEVSRSNNFTEQSARAEEQQPFWGGLSDTYVEKALDCISEDAVETKQI